MEIAIAKSCGIIRLAAFKGCTNLERVRLPDSLKKIEIAAFMECSSLRDIEIPKGLTEIERELFRGCSSLHSVTIPDGVTRIKESAFLECSSLTHVEFPSTLVSIAQYAFQGCASLEQLEFPKTFEKIEDYAFVGCSKLTSLSFPVGMRVIGNYAFANCEHLEDVLIQDGVYFIASAAFYNCSELRSVTIPESTTGFGQNVFFGCKDVVIYAPEGSYAQQYAAKAHLACQSTGKPHNADYITELVDGIAHIKYAGPGGDIVFPEGKISVSAGLFRDCASLTGITIPEGVERIEVDAFWGCENLSKVFIPSTLKTIEQRVFAGCSNLIHLEIHPDNPNFRFENGLILSKDGTTLYTGVGGIEGDVCIPEGVKKIVDSALYGCKKITGITLPDTVTATGTKAFAQCTALTALKLSEKTKKISAELCEGCKNLRDVQLPLKLTGIGKYTFADTGLEHIEFPEGLKVIANHAFDGASLTLLTLPASLEELGASAFANCPLQSVTFLGSQVKCKQKPFGEGDLPEIFVNGGSIANLPASIQSAAATSFARRYLAGEQLSDETKKDGLKYLKGHRKSLWRNELCLRVILQEKFITANDIGDFVEEAAKLNAPELTSVLLEYRNQNFSQETMDKAAVQKWKRGSGSL